MLDKRKGAVARRRPGAGHRQQGHRRRGRRAPGLPGQQGPRPVRPRARTARPGCCSSRPTSCTSSASSASTRTTSGSGCACTRRPTGCSSRAVPVAARPPGRAGPRASSRGLAPDPEELGAGSQQVARNLPDALRSGGGGPDRPVRHAGAARRSSAGSPPSCRCSRGTPTWSWTRWARRSSPPWRRSGRRFHQRRLGAGAVDRLLRRLLGLEAKMRQYRDGAVFVRDGHRRGRRRRVQRGLDLAATPCRCRRRSRARRPGSGASTA